MQQPPLLIQKQKIKSASSKFSTVTIVSIVLVLFIGTFIAFTMHRTQRESSTIQTIPQPKIGGSESLHQGPWPECVNMIASDCIKHIEIYAEDLRISHNFPIVQSDMMVTMDFNPSRVRIYVNDSNIVVQTPRRG